MKERRIALALLFVVLVGVQTNVFAQGSLSEKDNALFYAAIFGTAADVRAALKAGANVNARNEHGNTALTVAAANNKDPDVVKALIRAGANVNARSKTGFSALMAAALNNGNPDVVRALLAAGADKNARDSDGMRPIDYLEARPYENLIGELFSLTDAYWEMHDMLY